MASDRWIAFLIRTSVFAASVLTAVESKSADAQVFAASGSGEAPALQAKAANSPTVYAARQNRFYLRAGATLDLSAASRFGDGNCLSKSPAALYGCGTGGDGIARGTRGDFGMAGGVEFGIGFVATPGLRLETSIAYRPRFVFEGTANFLQTDALQSVSANLWSASAMAAVYRDLTALGPFRVFAGTGAGLHFIDIGESLMTFPRTQTIVPDGQRVDFAVMLAAGVSTSLADKITLDLAWRYVNWGTVETGSAAGQVIWKDGSRESVELDLAETWAMRKGQGFRVSLRYAL